MNEIIETIDKFRGNHAAYDEVVKHMIGRIMYVYDATEDEARHSCLMLLYDIADHSEKCLERRKQSQEKINEKINEKS